MNSFWDQELQARKAVFFKQYRNARLNETFSETFMKHSSCSSRGKAGNSKQISPNYQKL